MKALLYNVIWIDVVLISILSGCQPKEDPRTSQYKADSAARSKPGGPTVSRTTANRVLGVARVEPEDGILYLVAGTSGNVRQVLVRENDTVKAGQLLLLLDVATETDQLTQARSKLPGQQATIAASQASLDVKRVSLEKARTDYERNLKLLAVRAATQQTANDSRSEVDRLTKEVVSAEATLRQSRSRLTELSTDIRYYRSLLNQKRVVAPKAGKILTLSVNPGDYVSATTQLGELAPAGPLSARTEVDELFADRIRLGQSALLFSQATGDTLARGRVSFTADYLKQKSLFDDAAGNEEDRRVREVHVRIDTDKDHQPLIGSRVDCLILLK